MDFDEQRAHRSCRRCGNCCRVSGYVRLVASEIDGIAEYLGLSVADFTRSYTRLTRDRRQLSLIEQEDGSCVFLQDDSLCMINAVKPVQCREFPHVWQFVGFEDVCAAAKGDVEGGLQRDTGAPGPAKRDRHCGHKQED